MEKKKIFAIVLLSLALGFAVLEWIILPDIITIQVSITGAAAQTGPKWVGIMIPFILIILGVFLYYKDSEKYGVFKFLAILGVGIDIVTILFNCL